MTDRTDRHFRWLVRQISRRVVLYTEMVPARAMVQGRADALLEHDAVERPLVLQLGGSDPERLARCCARAAAAGFFEVNLNCGCPSRAARGGAFGARLMLDPAHVARCVAAMRAATPLPVTVKHRLGVDEHDDERTLLRFVDTVAEAGVTRFIVHARKAWLSGLNPAANRTVPPLRYDAVQRLARLRPQLQVELNGGLSRPELHGAQRLAGVMLGRAVFHDPMVLADVDGPGTTPSRAAVADAAIRYAQRWAARGGSERAAMRPMLGIFRGLPGGRATRRRYSEPRTADEPRPPMR